MPTAQINNITMYYEIHGMNEPLAMVEARDFSGRGRAAYTALLPRGDNAE